MLDCSRGEQAGGKTGEPGHEPRSDGQTTVSKAVQGTKVPTEKLARHRLSVLELALALGSASDVCLQRGVSRTQFYEYKRRFRKQSLDGLKVIPPIHKTHPQPTPPETVERILALCLECSGWGYYKPSAYLKLQGVSVSCPTIHCILAKHGLWTKYERLLRLEERALEEGIGTDT